MPDIRLIHWNADEAKERAKLLKSAGYKVDILSIASLGTLKALKAEPPAAFVIDLSRLPSHGRAVALALRQSKATRSIPIIFVDGELEKVERIRKLLPDASYTSWKGIRSSVKQAISQPPTKPVVPESVLAGYSGTPLPGKLAIKENSVVVLVEAPEDFEHTLGDLPLGAKLNRNGKGKRDITLWFVRSTKELDRGMERIVKDVCEGKLWIIWPKKASGIQSGVSEPLVQKSGLAAGLVDFKICAVDQTWSGLLFTKRKKQ